MGVHDVLSAHRALAKLQHVERLENLTLHDPETMAVIAYCRNGCWALADGRMPTVTAPARGDDNAR